MREVKAGECSCVACDIDAALAAHDAVPPSEERVDWWSQSQQEASMGQTLLRVWCAGPNTWRWTAWSPEIFHKSGMAATLDEAKAAAIAAARGLK